MDNEDILEKIFKLAEESNSRDTRMETKIDYMAERMDKQDERIDKQDELLAKMSETLNEQKHFSRVLDSVVATVQDHGQRIQKLETDAVGINALATGLKTDVKTINNTITEIKHEPASKGWATVKKIAWVFVSGLVGALSALVGSIFLGK